MKTISVILMSTLLFVGMNSCNGQSKKSLGTAFEDNLSLGDTLHKPKINVKVNKEFDSKGNLMRYDSTYTYVYKGSNMAIHDSLFPFKSFFDTHTRGFLNDKKGFSQMILFYTKTFLKMIFSKNKMN